MQYLAMRNQYAAILNRKDSTDTLAKTFFDLAIARLQRELRVPFMERTMVINTASGDVSTVTVPADYIETITFLVTEPNGYSRELQNVDLGTFARFSNMVQDGPVYYARQGSQWNVTAAIPLNSTAQFVYYGEMDTLVADTDEPPLALVAPDLIIYTALTYAADYFIDDRGPAWDAKALALLNQVQAQASDGENRTGTNAVEAAYDFDDGVY